MAMTCLTLAVHRCALLELTGARGRLGWEGFAPAWCVRLQAVHWCGHDLSEPGRQQVGGRGRLGWLTDNVEGGAAGMMPAPQPSSSAPALFLVHAPAHHFIRLACLMPLPFCGRWRMLCSSWCSWETRRLRHPARGR